MELIIKEFTNIYDVQLMLLIVGIGLFTALVDSRHLWARKNKKEAILAKGIGWTYFVGGIVLFILQQFLIRQ